MSLLETLYRIDNHCLKSGPPYPPGLHRIPLDIHIPKIGRRRVVNRGASSIVFQSVITFHILPSYPWRSVCL
ncbi:hypothetical protein FKM82_000982 [Ascaphus truei]